MYSRASLSSNQAIISDSKANNNIDGGPESYSKSEQCFETIITVERKTGRTVIPQVQQTFPGVHSARGTTTTYKDPGGGDMQGKSLLERFPLHFLTQITSKQQATMSTSSTTTASAILFDMDGTLLGMPYRRRPRLTPRFHSCCLGDLGVLCARVRLGPHRGVEE
jgi:hypothetical protein